MSDSEFTYEEVAASPAAAPSPSWWEDAIGALAEQFGGEHSDAARSEAEEWVRQAATEWMGVDPDSLGRERRALVVQRVLLVARDLSDWPGDLAFSLGARDVIRASLMRRFDGAVAEGPAWRVDPAEIDRPTWSEWRDGSSFVGADDAALLERLADEIFDPEAAASPPGA